MASNVPLTQPLNLRSDILMRFWHIDVADTEKYELYFQYYDAVCNRLRTSSEIVAMDATTHEDVFHVMDILWASGDFQTLTPPILRQALRGSTDDNSAGTQTQSPSDDMMNNTINLAIRLWLTMDIRARQFGGVGDVQWNDDAPLKDLVEQEFPKVKKGTGEIHTRDVLQDEEFTAPNLFRRRGIKTEFTEKLTNHLLYDPKAQTLMVYPLRHFLSLHRTCQAAILSEELIDETIKSLGILFPQDSQTETFMKQFQFKGRPGYDYPFPLPGSTRLSDFDYWQDRLAEMYFILKGPPTTWHQRFREDLAGWFSFWGAAVAITVMTFVFGSASVGLAAWSALLAQQSLEIAREGLALARDAATSCTPTTRDASMSTAVVKLVKRF